MAAAAVRWSPHSSRSNGGKQRFLIIGLHDHSLTLHQVDRRDRTSLESHVVSRHADLPGINAFDWSRRTENVVGIGLKTGTATLIRLRENGESSEVIAQYRPKQERKCNSISLSADEWLAVGLDRTRADPSCLNIFDAKSDYGNQSEPILRLCPNEPVSTVRFIPNHPQELLVGVQRTLIRLYDLRDGSPGHSAAVHVPTSNTHNIACDPLDDNYFASAGPTGTPAVTVWDKRWMSQTVAGDNLLGSVFEFRPPKEALGTSIMSLRYSGERRGRLGICSSSGELKIIDMVESPQSSLHESNYLPTNPYGGQRWSHNRYVSEARYVERARAATRDASTTESKLIAFDWMSSSTSPMRESSVITIRNNGKLVIAHVPSAVPQATITGRNDFAIALDKLSFTEAQINTKEPSTLSAPYEPIATAEDFGPQEYMGEDKLLDAEHGRHKCGPDSAVIARILATTTLQQERCRRGYLWDWRKNLHIVAGNWQLERLWKTFGHFQEMAANNGMVAESIDLSYVGVAGIWAEDVKLGPGRKLAPVVAGVKDTIEALNTSRELPEFEGERTDYPKHRQLCLAICGWRFTADSLEAECQELIDRGFYYRAIVQATLHNDRHLALNLLRMLIQSGTLQNIGLIALLASDTINDAQREMCLWMAADTTDTALKALLTFLSEGDWRDVIKTTYLHLGYRIALGLRYLNDTELSGFIQSETARAVKNGDPEGILLTGLSSDQTMDLMQTYIAKNADLQTAVLVTAVTNPVYIAAAADPRWEMWKETYFEQMQRWRAFPQRVHFVVQHSAMARSRDGKSLIQPPPAQISLRCNHCQAALARHDGRQPLLFGEVRGASSSSVATAGAGAAKNVRAVIGPAANAGTVCTKCGSHMPRCGICRLWLGGPDPGARTSGGRREAGKAGDLMANFLTFCVACSHGFHAAHARDWFAKHNVCPVPDCSCTCTVS